MTDSGLSNYLTTNDSTCLDLYYKLKRLIHWAPLLALFIIFYVAIITTNCIMHVFHPFSSVLNFIHFVIYVYQFYLIMNNYLLASFIGPGFVPLGWQPDTAWAQRCLQWCEFCEGFKPPRSHHCRKCDRCVMKMDHHCPWINTCCGHFNHGYFIYFLFFAPLGCLHSTGILTVTLYRAIHVDYYISLLGSDNDLSIDYESLIVVLSLAEFLCSFFAAGLAIGVVIAVGSLWVIQMRSVLRNETGVETWIKEKALLRLADEDELNTLIANEVTTESEVDAVQPKVRQSFVYPYHLGPMANLRYVITWSGRARGDGIHWPLKPGCGQYDFTIEQIRQKRDKHLHSQHYEIKQGYSGSLLPVCSMGCRVTWASPCTDEMRLAVVPGQRVKVTRWRKHWLYGQIVAGAPCITGAAVKKRRPRGWFPSSCARQCRESDQTTDSYSKINLTGHANGKAAVDAVSSGHCHSE